MASAGINLANFAQFGRKIIGIGANYRAVVKQTGLPMPTKPIVFFKLPSCYITKEQRIKFPPDCDQLFYEVELGVIIGKSGKKIPEDESMNYVGGYTCALDMTSWTHVKAAMENKQPWCLGKGFDTSCPVGDFIDKSNISDPHDLNIWLKLNGETKQNHTTGDMIFNIPKLISFISASITLEPGDLIVTGTPGGNGPVQHGDLIHAGQIVADLGFSTPEKPMLFFKLPTSYITKGEQVVFPPHCTELWHEVELGVVIGKSGKNVPEGEAMDHVGGYTCALDMTSWTHIKAAMENKQPWSIGKGFDTACPVGDFIDKSQMPDPQNINMWLKLNGETKQSQHTSEMVFSVPKLVSYISAFITLEAGDLIVTGSPPGYGCVKSGDVITAGFNDNSGSDISQIEYTVK